MADAEKQHDQNFEWISGGYYVVRTQAGFKQAIKHFHDIKKGDPAWEETPQSFGYPKTYPSLVHLSVWYAGYHYLSVDCIHVNELSRILARH